MRGNKKIKDIAKQGAEFIKLYPKERFPYIKEAARRMFEEGATYKEVAKVLRKVCKARVKEIVKALSELRGVSEGLVESFIK